MPPTKYYDAHSSLDLDEIKSLESTGLEQVVCNIASVLSFSMTESERGTWDKGVEKGLTTNPEKELDQHIHIALIGQYASNANICIADEAVMKQILVDFGVENPKELRYKEVIVHRTGYLKQRGHVEFAFSNIWIPDALDMLLKSEITLHATKCPKYLVFGKIKPGYRNSTKKHSQWVLAPLKGKEVLNLRYDRGDGKSREHVKYFVHSFATLDTESLSVDLVDEKSETIHSFIINQTSQRQRSIEPEMDLVAVVPWTAITQRMVEIYPTR